MFKTSSILLSIFSLTLISFQEIHASSSAVMQSNVRSSTQTITRTIRKQIHHSLAKYRTKSNLNMRTRPKGKIIITLSKGTTIEVLDQSQGKWWKINYNNQDGWVHSNYLEKI